jgi:GH25 family lysozyme M1 (1,4-beta-N-acetylmuramidase)
VTEWLIDAHCTYQAGLDVEKLAEEGYSALVVKATQGSSGYWAPAAFDDWTRRARAAGMIPGAYHWINNSDPIQQVDYFLRRLQSVGGPDGMLIQLDCEDTATPATAATVTLWIREWNRRTGNHPLLFYSGAWWYPAKLGSFQVAKVASNVHQWDSHYVTGAGYASALYEAVPAGWWTSRYGGFGEVTVMQFSSAGHAGGLAGGVDVNAFRGTRADLHTLAGHTLAGDDMGALDYGHFGKPGAGFMAELDRADCQGALLADLVAQEMDEASDYDGHSQSARTKRLIRIENAVNALQNGGVDLDALAAKVAALIPAPPTAAAVAEEIAKRLGNG